MFKVVANSPVSLESMWGSFGALGAGVLGPKLGEHIAVAIANRNLCEYRLAAHAALGKNARVSEKDISEAQVGRSTGAKTAAALSFVLKVVSDRAQITADNVRALHNVGFTDGEVVEIMAHIALDLFKNYINVALCSATIRMTS